MNRGCAAVLSLLACACASDDTTPKKACSSSLKGDFQFEACGAFCKQAKSGNHCKFCKCKSCTFCPASSSASTSAPPASSPSLRRSAPPPPRWPKKMKKGRGGNSSAGKGGSSVAKAKKTKCESGLKGDLPFMTCGSFCKAAKAGNHCKFCKCRTCAYCTAEGKQNEGYVPATPAAHSFGATAPPPRSAPGGALIDTAAISTVPSSGPPQRGVPVDTAAKTGGSHMRLIQGLGIAVLLVLLGLGLVAFTSQGDATIGSWRHTLQEHLAKMGLADYGREGTRLNMDRDDEGSSSNLDDAFRAVDKLEADMGTTR